MKRRHLTLTALVSGCAAAALVASASAASPSTVSPSFTAYPSVNEIDALSDYTEDEGRLVAVSIVKVLLERDIEIVGFSFDVPLTSLTISSPAFATTAARADAHRDAASLLPAGVTVAFTVPTERIALAPTDAAAVCDLGPDDR